MTLGNQWKDLGFKESDIVSVYTDEQAVEDGVLVRSEGVLPCPFNRVTRAVWDEFTQPMGPKGSVIVMTNTTKLSQLGEAVNRKYKAGELTEGWVVLEFEGHKIWAMPNETTYSKITPVLGWTIMFPDDY
jgi:hypothetical protein